MADTSRTVKVKFDGDAKGLARASKDGEREIDRFSKSVDKKFRTSGDDSGKGFAAGLRKWFSPRALGDLKKSGEFGGTLFGSGLLGAIKTPVLGPAIVATLGAVVATTLPAVGAIAGSGLVAGFGAGLAGLGLVFAAKSDAVQKKWQQTTAAMGADMRLFAKPYEATLIHAADVADRTFGRFAPSLERSFAETAPVVSRFVDDLGDGLGELEPAVQPLSSAFQSVLKQLGPAMQSAIRNVSGGLRDLADSVKKNPDALADTVRGIGDLTNSALGLLSTLNDVNGGFRTLTGGTSLVTVVMRGLEAAMWPVIIPFQGLNIALDTANRLTKPVGDGFQYTATSAQEAATASGYWTQGLSKAQLAAMGITGATKGAGAAAENLTTKYNRQKSVTDALIGSLFRLQGLALGLSGAQIGYQAALDAATASVKENGRTLNINTDAGRANQSALNSLAQSANQQTQAMIESGKGTAAAARTAESSRSNFIRLATQMGLSKEQAQAMAAQMIAIPNVSRTAKLQANKKDLEEKLAAAKTALADPKLTATKRAELQARIADLQAGIAEAKRLLAGVPSSKTVTIRYSAVGVKAAIEASTRGGGKRASGGLTQPKRRYLLGERGAEIAEFGGTGTGGPRILSAEQTRQELGRSEQPLIVENHIEIGGEVVRVVRTEIKANDRSTARRATAGVRAA